MSCLDCFNGCVEPTSDQCVKYTGIDIPELSIYKGNSLASVLQKMNEAILALSTTTTTTSTSSSTTTTTTTIV